MSTGVEGTLRFEGLIEGHLPDDDDLPERLRGWVREARGAGLGLDLEAEHGRFSLLAGADTVPARALGQVPSVKVRALLERLVALFPDPATAALFSTLRSTEVAPGQEVQTLYVVHPDGRVEAPERVVEARTVAPPAPPSVKHWLRAVGVAVLALAALLVVTSLFVDWRQELRSAWRVVAPLDVEAIEVDASAFARYLDVAGPEKGARATSVRLTLRRAAAYPTTDEAFRDAYVRAGAASPPPWREIHDRLVLDALARGYVRAEVFDAQGGFLGQAEVRVAGLAQAETVVVDVPVPHDPRPARIVLRP